jgi:KDO2-lipid IV(A) lauroyltransferase
MYRCLGELEEEVIQAPSDWLWSHKRWKHKRPDGVEVQQRMFERTLES